MYRTVVHFILCITSEFVFYRKRQQQQKWIPLMRSTGSLFIAGTETTAFSLAWSLYYLSKNPDRFKRCREEALRVAPLRYVYAADELWIIGDALLQVWSKRESVAQWLLLSCGGRAGVVFFLYMKCLEWIYIQNMYHSIGCTFASRLHTSRN